MADGFLPVYKEQGFTSMDAVAKLRGILHTKKIGHAGTLDPMAEGVLLTAVGSATRAISLLPVRDKEYIAGIRLGTATDTEDIWGNVTEQSDNIVPKQDLEAAILSFQGGYDQVPPMVSAKKVGGRKLYQLAREGKTVERKPVRVEIPEIEILSAGQNTAEFRVRCSEGTYIRSLCRDIGAKLSMPACMSRLTRTEACGVRISQALTLSRIQELADAGTIADNIVSIPDMLGSYPGVTVSQDWTMKVLNGSAFPRQAVCGSGGTGGPLCRVFLSDGRFQGVYRKEGDIYMPVKILGGRN
ncbi:MAG: tRNA pseudouridine(55) synthase TruB [Lachnospiraceae bacterium]|jgi:tRNA pseudouridine55 synthase